jgi:hypothetical protein
VAIGHLGLARRRNGRAAIGVNHCQVALTGPLSVTLKA